MNKSKFKILFNYSCDISSSSFYGQLLRYSYLLTYPDQLRRILGDDYEIIVPRTDSDVPKLAHDADVIIGLDSAFSPAVVEAAERVRLLQVFGAGVEGLPFDMLRGRKVYVANMAGSYNSISVAEHALALILALAKRIVRRHNDLCVGKWMVTPSTELHDKVLGIVGLGNIGKEIAKRAAGFGMRIYATKRMPQDKIIKEFNLEFLGGPKDLDHLLKHSDFLVITVPLTSETRGLIGEKELKMMKSSSYLINVSRGPVVREEVLYLALREKWIAGAGIDAWYLYPPKSNAPSSLGLHLLENVVGTPHIAGTTYASINNYLTTMSENIKRVRAGGEPISMVNINETTQAKLK
jgi:phosphoglycerate dehydrogenase-like enzyme